MAPEYGATCGIFPVDDETLRYLRFTGRAGRRVALVEAYAREQGLFHGADDARGRVHQTSSSSTSATVEPSLAGPKRPQDRVSLFQTRKSFEDALPSLVKPKAKKKPAAPDRRSTATPTSATRRRRRPSPDVEATARS